MDVQLIAVILVPLLLIGLWWWLRKRGAGDVAEPKGDRLDTIIGWPPEATRILSTTERLAFTTLRRALPEYVVLAQVPMARFIKVAKRNSYGEWLRRVGNLRADLVVCDTATQVIAVVNLQAPGSATDERSVKRQQRMARVLKSAKIPSFLWMENMLPSADAARAQILPAPPPTPEGVPSTVPVPPQPAPIAAAVPTVTSKLTPAAPKANPFEDLERDTTQDELIELREPPPSTWFDDLDTGPAPLQPPTRPNTPQKR